MYLALIISVMSCGTSEKIFGKRKYQKGVYYEKLTAKGGVEKNDLTTHSTFKKEVEIDEPKKNSNQEDIFASADNSIVLQRANKSKYKVDNEATKELLQDVIILQKKLKDSDKHNGDPDVKKGNKHRNWAAILGFILAFFIPLIAVWLCFIGLKSQYPRLAKAGSIICIVLLVIQLALVAAPLILE